MRACYRTKFDHTGRLRCGELPSTTSSWAFEIAGHNSSSGGLLDFEAVTLRELMFKKLLVVLFGSSASRSLV